MPDIEGNPLDEAEARAIVRGPAGEELLKVAAQYAVPIFWALDGEGRSQNRILHNGSGFFLRVDGPTILVTAAHVIREFERDRQEYGARVKAQVGDVGFDPLKHLVDIDDSIEIATINVPDGLPARLGRWPYERQLRYWPPPPPTEGRGLFFLGFPGEYRTEVESNEVLFGTYGGLAVATSVGDSHIVCQLEREHLEPIARLRVPPRNASLGGMSGAPGWTLTQVGWRLAGVLFEYHQENELFYFRRADSIKPDGSLS